jgi:YesN/AraC family two-component response regulator
VEDEVDLRNYIKSIFTQFQVITATNGIEGFNLACEHIPDIIICDVMMPEMDGFELTKAIKTNESTSHIPVILLTAKNTNEDQLKGLQLGAIDYIAKPFNSNSLLLKVNNQIKNRREFGKQFIGNPDINVQKLKFNSTDQKFINKLNDILEANYTDPDFDFSQICSQIGLSRAQLYRKVTAITGKTVNEYIRIYRLKKAAQMLIDEGLNVSEIMYNVGFKNSSYFAKCFKDFFGVLPSEYLKEKK